MIPKLILKIHFYICYTVNYDYSEYCKKGICTVLNNYQYLTSAATCSGFVWSGYILLHAKYKASSPGGVKGIKLTGRFRQWRLSSSTMFKRMNADFVVKPWHRAKQNRRNLLTVVPSVVRILKKEKRKKMNFKLYRN